MTAANRTTTTTELTLGSAELAKILTYPRASFCESKVGSIGDDDDDCDGANDKYDANTDDGEYANRLAELRGLGVTAVFAGGKTVVGGTNIAGKGCVGLVVKAMAFGKICALKIRRIDANRSSMENEVRYHKIANEAGVGPSIINHSANFLLMEFVEGSAIVDWALYQIAENRNPSRHHVSQVIVSVLEQCYLLDKAGLDHGELSHVNKHVIVDGTHATIIDFESASTERKVSNVTAAGQSILVSGSVAGALANVLPLVKDRQRIISSLKKYKRDQTRSSFEEILSLVVD